MIRVGFPLVVLSILKVFAQKTQYTVLEAKRKVLTMHYKLISLLHWYEFMPRQKTCFT